MAYRKTERVETRLADNRNRILAAARALVAEGGWAEAQIGNVALAADVATGSVYRYFPSKADLFVEVLSIVSQREVDVLGAIADSGENPRTRLHAAVATFVTRAMRARRLAYAMIAEPCEKEIEAARLVYRAGVSRQIVRIVEDGQRDGAFRADVDSPVAATVIVGGFMESLIGPLSPLNADVATEAAQKLAAEIADICCAAVAPRDNIARIKHNNGRST